MKKLFLILAIIGPFIGHSQNPTMHQPKIMVIPFTKAGEDLRTILDNDVNRRIAITKVKEGFDNKGFQTVDFLGKLKAANDNRIFTSDNQTDIKSAIVEASGCDVYVLVEVNSQKETEGSSVNVIVSSYEAATGNSLSNKVGNSGQFFTDDFGKLTSKAVDKCIDAFTESVITRFSELEKQGQSVLLFFSFGENASVNMTSEIDSEKLALSDVLENWVSKTSVNGNYHIQGTTSLKMIFDDVKIPLRDQNNNRFTANKFALQLFSYLKSIGLNPAKDIKGNTIYIAIN